MSISPRALPASSATESISTTRERPELGDFSTDTRVILLSTMALVVGGVSALVATALVHLIQLITNVAFLHRWSAGPGMPQEHTLGAWVIGVPVVGALIIGFMARYGSEKIRGHGIPEALEAILLGRSRIQLKVAILKPLSAAISIGTGGPFGAEGPIIMTGGAFGSIFAQQFHLSSAERKTLLVAGAAAGMSAIFNSPVAAVLLAVELLLFEWKPRSFIPVAVAATCAAVLRIPLLGAGPIFPIPAHASPGASEMIFAAVVGILAGFGSGLLTRLVYALEDLFHSLPFHWMWWPAVGAVFVGIGGYFQPHVLGVGYDVIHGLLRGDLARGLVLGILVAKALVWAIALGSGTSGGVLAPLLILGGCLGAALAPFIPAGNAGLWALVGMTAMMGGTMRAPLTSILFAVELTSDFHAFPALLIAAVCSLAVTVLVMKRSILTEKLSRRGHHITREYSVDPFELARVGDVMDEEVPTIRAGTPVAELSDRLADMHSPLSRRQGTIIVNDHGELAGIITRADIVRALRDPARARETVEEAGNPDVVVAFPEESLHLALSRMFDHDIGRLPVVDFKNPKRVVGYLGRATILKARHRWHEEESIRQRGADKP